MNHVKDFRKNLGLSQLDLAKQIGVSRQTINMIENNKYNPTLELCINLALALGTDLNTLFWNDKNDLKGYKNEKGIFN
ncbi:helix-turn-helix transcriptional regulator [Streptococcus anginosus]|uniref:helix-turn-helix transcriptional regulator n=1 Tax=Streptococcus anginosus TaxID=1328 RepID=UPI00189B5EFE|nr:helix-turn-helix transcriptional regulator [Streptococcus anginosus]MDB8657024.1 helix-turn-helix transcriptional regulator [Streptococcus anginosus]MDX5015549.1 helix-turn-helix transcriptional regulator [Streptococcus anginosus]MDX5019652.1 helix-turn-helix transcriptional regulator [Streptococcus anginosus]